MGKSTKFVLGALFGAAAAILLTPMTGKKARSNLKKMAEKGLDTDMIEEGAGAIVAKGKDILKSLTESKEAPTFASSFAEATADKKATVGRPRPRRKTKSKK